MVDAFTTAGFRIATIAEPPPAPSARDRFAAELPATPTAAFLGFLFFVLDAV